MAKMYGSRYRSAGVRRSYRRTRSYGFRRPSYGYRRKSPAYRKFSFKRRVVGCKKLIKKKEGTILSSISPGPVAIRHYKLPTGSNLLVTWKAGEKAREFIVRRFDVSSLAKRCLRGIVAAGGNQSNFGVTVVRRGGKIDEVMTQALQVAISRGGN